MPPDPVARPATVTPLHKRIVQEIEAEGPMTVARFMELALYHPEDGYYTAGPRRAGTEWTTAPTLHPIFAKTLALGLAPLLAQVDDPVLAEVGTGSGELMRDVAYGLAEAAPEVFEQLHLVVVDRSEPALARARSTLERAGIVLDEVTLATELPDRIEGVVFSNELLDAIPTHQAQVTPEGLHERRITVDDGQLDWTAGRFDDPATQRLAEALASVEATDLRFEVPVASLAWYERAIQALDRGAILTIDYGATARAIQAAIPEGTLHGYHRGRPTTEVLRSPGEVDLTFLVPFDQVAAQGEAAGLATAAYTTQEMALEHLGIRTFADEMDAMDVLAAKKLIDPAGAGGTFQWLLQTKGIQAPGPWPTGHERVEGPADPPAPWRQARLG